MVQGCALTRSGELNHLNRGMPKLLITQNRTIYFVLLPLVAGVLLVLSGIARAQNCTDDGSGPYGSLLDHRELNQAVQALPPAAFLTPPVQPPLPPHAYLYNRRPSLSKASCQPWLPRQLRSAILRLWPGLLHRSAPGRWFAQVGRRAGREVSKPCLSFRVGNIQWICTLPQRR